MTEINKAESEVQVRHEDWIYQRGQAVAWQRAVHNLCRTGCPDGIYAFLQQEMKDAVEAVSRAERRLDEAKLAHVNAIVKEAAKTSKFCLCGHLWAAHSAKGCLYAEEYDGQHAIFCDCNASQQP